VDILTTNTELNIKRLAELRVRLDELESYAEHCAGHSDAPGACGTCVRIANLKDEIALYEGLS
jgi:hypothetical protein